MDTTNFPDYYNHTVSFAPNNYLNLYRIGRHLNSPSFSYPQYNNYYTISFIADGQGTVETRGKKYTLGKNDVFITLPNELSIQTADINNPWELYYFSFNGDLSETLIERTVFKNNILCTTVKNQPLAEIILEATVYMNEHTYSEFETFEILFKLLAKLDVYNSVPLTISNTSEQKYVSEIKKYIQTHYLEPIKISDIADKLNINRSHLYRTFKKEMGVSVEEYIINIKMNYAKSLLVDTELTTTAISTLVGYKNYPTFFKRFKNIIGISPKDYRKKYKKQ